MQKEDKYLIHLKGKDFGPFTRLQVQNFLDEGRFGMEDLCCLQRKLKWGKVKDFFDSSTPLPIQAKNSPELNLDDSFFSYKKSWTASLFPCSLWLIFGLMSLSLPFGYCIFFLILLGIIFGLWLYSLRKYLLYTDSTGVWISYGIFPWTKGVIGILWRDMDECVFVNGFIGWLFNSYTVIASHRFTKSDEIMMSHTKNGKQAIIEINRLHHEYLGISGEASKPLEG